MTISKAARESADRLYNSAYDWALNEFDVSEEIQKAIDSETRELLEALEAMVDFCDDPKDSGESLALGLARLLPSARTAVKKAKGQQ